MPRKDYELVIGLEVHCQLDTKTKLFTDCPFVHGGEANTHVDPFSIGLPGTLPVPNARAVNLAVRLALATECEVHRLSRFARKHYFYPDMPQGYQITQSDQPYATGGRVQLFDDEGGLRREVRLTRIHLEGDAGKNVHGVREGQSAVDYNRAGAPLVEIVSEPDIRSAREAADYLRKLRRLVRWIGVSDADMEKGRMRCDANVSLRKKGSEELGTRCEIKNLNSFKFLESAIEAEARRQADMLDRGEAVVQSTMAYDADKDRTWVMRAKEDAADYLYFPDPDLPPLRIESASLDAAKHALPELPDARAKRYARAGLSAYDAGVLTSERVIADYFDACLEAGAPAKKACNWLTVEMLGRLNAEGKDVSESPMSAVALSELVLLVEEGAISGRAAKEVFDKAYKEGLMPKAIVERDGYKQMSDTGELQAIVQEILAANAAQLAEFRSGKEKVRGFFVGQVMKRTRGQANPKVVNELLSAARDAKE
jgi:aspartyl-tRNA(Asn)/glutamyl-tRNA(Gln) amidotransferase subunit B